MKIIESMMKPKVRNAILIGSMCSISYFAVYFAKNVLGAVSPQMVESGYSEAFIGKVSSMYFTLYAFGQLINGAIGDRIKARYMISTGLLMAGITNLLFSYLSSHHQNLSLIAYGFTGFFLSMIYGPMTKTVAENTEPIYAPRCSLGYTFSSFIASPLAGIAAAALVWQSVFRTSSGLLITMAIISFFFFLLFEKKGIIRYRQFEPKVGKKSMGSGIKVLIRHRIVKFTLIAIITGVVRTTVVFWLPTYLAQHLGFSSDVSALIFTAATLVISFTTFISVFVYEKLGRNMDLTILLMFTSASIFFLLVFAVKMPILNIIFLILAIMSSNGASSMLWSRYCPSLRNTGMVSAATGFLDFTSYMAASASSTLFANAVTSIGWGNLILVWFALMAVGVVLSLPGSPWKHRVDEIN